MQIEKINENQIEIILTLHDLKKNNINIHSFMCSSSLRKNLFFNILNLVNSNINFNLNNYEIITDFFCVPSLNSFIMIISRIPKATYLHISKTKYGTFKFNKCLWLTFDNFEYFCMFCNSLKSDFNLQSSLYLLDNCYFLQIKSHNLKDFLAISTMAKEFLNTIHNNNFILDENSKSIIKSTAIQTCKKYFV